MRTLGAIGGLPAPRIAPRLPGVTLEPSIEQLAALPYRRGTAGCEILLVTSRETRRWIIPKGNPIPGLEDYLAAAREAFEEGGVIGHPYPEPVGTFSYMKLRKTRVPASARVTVYPLAVATLLESWPERNQRQRRWFSQAAAAEAVAEAELQDLLRSFRPAPVSR